MESFAKSLNTYAKSVEMETPVPSAEEQKRVDAGVEAGLDHLPDQNVVVAAVMHGVAPALEYTERVPKDRRPGLAARPGRGPEPVLVARRKADRRRLLSGLQNVDREMLSFDQRRRARRLLGQAHQQQRRVERNRGEAVDGEARRRS